MTDTSPPGTLTSQALAARLDRLPITRFHYKWNPRKTVRGSGTKVVSAVFSAALAVMLAACGASSGSNGAGSSSGDYVVGVPMPMTGPEAQAGTEIFDAEQLAASQINAAGGVLGHKIVLNEQDDACDPQTSVNAANKLVSEGVQAVAGQYCSSAALPAEPIYARAGLPDLQSAANSTSLTQQHLNNVFLLDPSGGLQGQTAAGFFVSVMHASKIVIADDQSAYSVNVAQLAATDVSRLGATVASLQAVPATTTDFSSVIAKVRQTGATVVYWTGYYAQAALFVKQLRSAGSNVTFVGADGSVDPTYIADAGSVANGSYATIALTSQFIKGPMANAFDSAYQSKYHSAPGPYSAYGYDTIYALANAAKQAGSLQPAKVVAALHKVNFQGLTGSVSFDSSGNRVGAKFVVLEVMNGAYALAPKQP
jgi:branched-chain amino acid transport system substrate-binding protein